MASPRDDLDEQVRRNKSTRGSFEDFTGHRTHVMRLLLAAAAEFVDRPRLIMLGAGNCNDVDLAGLLLFYDQIQLVDWDAAALVDALKRQNLTGEERIACHAPVDLSSSDWSLPHSAEPTVVASLCVLSQLIDSAAQAAAAHSANPADRIEAAGRHHLRQIVKLLPSAGIRMLITDFTSFLTAPELPTASETQLPLLVARLLAAGNFFQGLHPGALFRLLTTDPWFARRISCHNPTPPWNWKVRNRVYAVSALVMRRNLAATGMIETQRVISRT